MRSVLAYVGGLVAGLAIGGLVVNFLQSEDIARLQRTVACLQHPTHAISAVGPVGLQGPIGRNALPSLVVCP